MKGSVGKYADDQYDPRGVSGPFGIIAIGGSLTVGLREKPAGEDGKESECEQQARHGEQELFAANIA